jgi:hypothetical protein
MANFVFNVARGRVRTYYDNVDTNSPAASALIVVPLESSGLEADATLADHDDLAALLAGTSNEQTTVGRKTLTDTELDVSAQDDTNNRLDLDIPDQTWAGATGAAIGALVICYDPDTGAGTDSTLVPLTKHDFAVTPDGSDIVAQINAAGFYRSS